MSRYPEYERKNPEDLTEVVKKKAAGRLPQGLDVDDGEIDTGRNIPPQEDKEAVKALTGKEGPTAEEKLAGFQETVDSVFTIKMPGHTSEEVRIAQLGALWKQREEAEKIDASFGRGQKPASDYLEAGIKRLEAELAGSSK